MYLVRSVTEILNVAVENSKMRLKEESKGKDKYIKRMKNGKKLNNKR